MPALSAMQFGMARPLTEFQPPVHGTQIGISQPRYYPDVEPPKSLSKYNNSGPKADAWWPKPSHHVLGYGTATQGSNFTPYGAPQF